MESRPEVFGLQLAFQSNHQFIARAEFKFRRFYENRFSLWAATSFIKSSSSRFMAQCDPLPPILKKEGD